MAVFDDRYLKFVAKRGKTTERQLARALLLQKEISRSLGRNVREAMLIASRLLERKHL